MRQMPRPNWYVRVNLTREKNYLRGNEEKYDGVFLSANVLESFPKAFANFLYRSPKPYVIDPINYIFGPSTLDLTDKRWWASLTQAYGLSEVLAPGFSSLSPEKLVSTDGLPTANLSRFVNATLSYQKSRIETVAKSFDEIESFVSGPSAGISRRPQLLVAPYFLMPTAGNPWATVNRESLCIAVASKGEYPLYAVIFIDKSLLGFPTELERIAEHFSVPGIDGYMVWIADFRETEAPVSLLRGFRDFIRMLSSHDKPVINMFGGLFSYLLGTSGLKGVSHSLCYGESKDPLAEGGGFFVRYYHPRLRTKIPAGRIQDFLVLRPHHLCSCNVCTGINATHRSWDSISIEEAAIHYLNKRAEELDMIDHDGTAILLRDFQIVVEEMRAVDRTGAEEQFYTHLTRWSDALSH